MNRELKLFFIILALTAFGLGLTNDVLSNYFKDAYQVTAYQRGLIEFPRELPGLLCIVVIAALTFLGDIKIAMIAQILSALGIAALGFFTPTFTVMLIFIFINSLGMHTFFPLQESIGLSLLKGQPVGKMMGLYKGVFTAFQLSAALIVFFGFKYGLFSFITETKLIFIIAGAIFIVIFVLLIVLDSFVKNTEIKHEQTSFIYRKEYNLYYILVILYGVQKQIMIVFGPWVLIDLLNKKADTIALLAVIGGLVGVFFIPAIGRWIDRFGIKKLLYADALSFIGVYLLYGFLSAGFFQQTIALTGIPVLLAYLVFILDRMSSQMGIIRTVYLKSILIKNADLTPTLSLGISMDHVVSIICAYTGGIIWKVWGPQYIFFLAAGLSLINLYVAVIVKKGSKNEY
ncbi:MAG: MFS transporter [Spirochaetes bacterium]|nr:MFS transporter [Spirochaetota bacterium]